MKEEIILKKRMKNLLLTLALGMTLSPVRTFAATQIIDSGALSTGEVEAGRSGAECQRVAADGDYRDA